MGFDIDSLLVTSCCALCRDLGCLDVEVWVFDGGAERLELRASAKPEGLSRAASSPLAYAVDAQSFVARAFRAMREPKPRISDRGPARRKGELVPIFFEKLGDTSSLGEVSEPAIFSELGIGLSAEGGTLGVFHFAGLGRRPFADAELFALRGLAAQMATALWNAELHEAEERRSLESESLREASTALNASLDLAEVLDRILLGLSRVLEIDSASIMLREGDRVVFATTTGLDRANIAGTYPPMEDLHFVKTILESCEPVIIADTKLDTRWFRTPGNDYIRCWIGVPLMAKGRAIGILTVDNRKPGFYTRHHAELAASFAGQAAIAIENSRLYEAEERRRKEAETLRDVGAAISASLDQERALELILEGLQKLLDYDSATLMLERAGRIEIVAARWPGGRGGFDSGADFSQLPNVRRTMASDSPILIRDTMLDSTWTRQRVEGDDYIRCWIGIPLRVEGSTIGILNVDHHVPCRYGEHERDLAQSFANHAAIAIRNARLYSTAMLEIEERRQAEARSQKANAEKLEFLSGLVSVIAHEVNTPAGVAVTAASHLGSIVEELRSSYLAGSIDEEGFLRILDESAESIGIVRTNLQRVADLVRTFKKIAVDQQVDEKRSFDVKEYLEATLLSLKPKLRGLPHKVRYTCPEGLTVDTTPGAFYQILANLISNSLTHAFPSGRAGNIDIDISAKGRRLDIVYGDDGIGIPPENISLVLKPFFTTARARGGTGLGLYIVDNLVAKLNGSLSLRSPAGEGVRFRIEIPGIVVQGGTLDER